MNYIDKLLKEVGFEEGLTTLKEAAIELLERKSDEEEEFYKEDEF